MARYGERMKNKVEGSSSATPEPVLRLKVLAGAAVGTEFEVGDELMIGREAEGVGKLGGDPEISRRHARIARAAAPHNYAIEDLGSTNGTFVNDRRIGTAQPLAEGDRIEVGDTTLKVEVHGAPASAEPSTPQPPGPAPEPAAPEPSTREPVTEREPTAAPPMARLSLRVEIDSAAGTWMLEIEGEARPLKLVHEDGRWRLGPGE